MFFFCVDQVWIFAWGGKNMVLAETKIMVLLSTFVERFSVSRMHLYMSVIRMEVFGMKRWGYSIYQSTSKSLS